MSRGEGRACRVRRVQHGPAAPDTAVRPAFPVLARLAGLLVAVALASCACLGTSPDAAWAVTAGSASANSGASAQSAQAKALSWKQCLKSVKKAPKSKKLKLGHKVKGYKVSKKRWKAVKSAIRSCRKAGANVGFVMVDCSTGMTVSYNPDKRFYGASTIKGLYVTYLFQQKLEKGALSLGSVSGLIKQTIVHSNNDTYLYLRSHYGSQAGFRKWLKKAGVGSLGTWAHYSPRTLAKAWTRMYGYTKTSGRYVGTWKSTFDHSYRSFIHDTLGGKRDTYTKPGWTPSWWSPGTKGPATNDAGVVYDRHGRQYIVAILSDLGCEHSNAPLRKLARALDALHMSMPASR